MTTMAAFLITGCEIDYKDEEDIHDEVSFHTPNSQITKNNSGQINYSNRENDYRTIYPQIRNTQTANRQTHTTASISNNEMIIKEINTQEEKGIKEETATKKEKDIKKEAEAREELRKKEEIKKNKKAKETKEAENKKKNATTTKTLSSFTTNFNAANKSRAANIQLASEKLNGTVVEPGAVFSFNSTIGPTGRANGYKQAKVIVKGKETINYGGGVCQVSSTLFNAADEAGMKIVERHNHSKPVQYVKSNRDAATSYGGIDFKFKNNKEYPVKISSYVKGNSMTVSITQKA